MKKKQKKIIEAAAEYGGAAVGAAAGAGIGLVVAGPAGASLGAIAGTALEKAFLYIGKEITERKLSKAENVVFKSIEFQHTFGKDVFTDNTHTSFIIVTSKIIVHLYDVAIL